MRVVVADDSTLLREGVVRLLEDAGLEVVGQAGDAEELLRKVRAHKPDVAVVDVRMPPTHTDEGLRAAREIRAELPEVAVLVLSQYVEVAYARELLAESAEGLGYLLKDRVADGETLADAVRRVGGGGSALDPEVVSEMLGRTRRDDPLAELSPREREVLGLMAEGRTNAAIAAELVVTDRAVEKHVTNIFAKLDLPASSEDHRRVLAVLRFLNQPGEARLRPRGHPVEVAAQLFELVAEAAGLLEAEVVGGGEHFLLEGDDRALQLGRVGELAAGLAAAFLRRPVLHREELGHLGDPLADGLRGDPVLLVVGELDRPAPVGLAHRRAHRVGLPVRVHQHPPVDVAGGAADRLHEAGLAAQEALLVGVEDRHQRDLGQVQPLAQQVDPDQDVVLAEAQVADDLDPFQGVDLRVQVADLDPVLEQVVRSGPRPSSWSAS